MIKELPKEKDLEDVVMKRNEALLRATTNLTEICNLSKDSQNKKYQYLPFWLEKESKLLLRELKNPRKFFNTYKRGTIVRVDFGVNIGCEFSQVHYAIVLNKKDNRLSETISVMPLTSKDKGSNLNIGNVIFDNAMKTINIQLEKVEAEKEIQNNDVYKLFEVIKFYSLNPISSFACYRNIITISKSRIKQPLNEYDFINKAICDNAVMEKIDKEMVKYYTNIGIK